MSTEDAEQVEPVNPSECTNPLEDEIVLLREIKMALAAEADNEVMVAAVAGMIEERSAALDLGRADGV